MIHSKYNRKNYSGLIKAAPFLYLGMSLIRIILFLLAIGSLLFANTRELLYIPEGIGILGTGSMPIAVSIFFVAAIVELIVSLSILEKILNTGYDEVKKTQGKTAAGVLLTIMVIDVIEVAIMNFVIVFYVLYAIIMIILWIAELVLIVVYLCVRKGAEEK